MDAERARRRMIESHLRGRDITDPRVIEAMTEVDRREFVPVELRNAAFDDRALPLARGQTISQPYVVAAMIQALELEPTDHLLEVGAGSGYAAAVAARLAADVVAIEQDADLARDAAERLERLGVDNVTVVAGDGSGGWPDAAPFDAILVSAAARRLPEPLLDQLAPGGRLVAPVGPAGAQVLVQARREGDSVAISELFGVAFVPLLGRHAGG